MVLVTSILARTTDILPASLGQISEQEGHAM
jgi:hypothetical protein